MDRDVFQSFVKERGFQRPAPGPLSQPCPTNGSLNPLP